MPAVPRPSGSTPGALRQREYDVIVLGAGSTGENVAGRAVKGGLSAIVVEAELVGGDCSYWACMPSKTLLRSPEALDEAVALPGAREAVRPPVDTAAVLRRRNEFVHDYDDSSQVAWLDGASIALVRGVGRLAGERRVEVAGYDGSTAMVTARHAVAVCTGSEPALPPVDGLDAVAPWMTRDATSATAAPRRLLVLGGGVSGCELATAWKSLGSAEVTVLQGGERLLPAYEPEVHDLLADSLRGRGITVRTSATVIAARRDDTGVTLTLADGSEVTGDELLVAAGRAPRTADLGLDTVGLAPGKWLDVDDAMSVREVPGGWLYAAGDVTHRALLTHMGKYQARVCGDVIAARARGERAEPSPWSRYAASADASAVPQVVFTDPQVAAVGRTEAQARAAGLPVRAVSYDIGAVAGASVYADGYRGWAKLVVDEDRRVVVGVTLVGAGVGELLHAATVAVVGEVPLERLWHAVPSYPTISEIWLRLLEEYGL